MEVIGLAHPVVSTTASAMQKMAEQSRSFTMSETGDNKAVQSAAVADQASLGLSIDDRVRPVDASSESLLQARTPVETLERRLETGVEGVPENETYEFPEELPMNFMEMIDMWRVEKPTDINRNDGLSITDPARAAEAQRMNRTV